MASTRFSQMVKVRPLCKSWEIKMKERQEKKMVKEFAKQLKEEKLQKSEIRNPAKLKRTQKKQLRSIEKRDTLMFCTSGERIKHTQNALSNKRPRQRKNHIST
ncbi:hypothetical protein XENTR_v10018503 [Xenopus tropicalis]|uniref:Coiled-coil domain-containing protein 86 n=1 Tax=Xenopus tropicalis TaxID=8364 RepID=A0A8J0R2A6_XENTR|nr:coiled-coil domain-containing protein 86 isoform X2 [Xenopus tropicalis]KAE8591581.1 hypothetical protein XENTR_v10018503 [Xenopus tropicalis]|eukprot:XP_004917181.1 PREDICTED: coiled-coil domain-containing protein 86 isoform X2 [Xenopus tropicalis]